MKSAAYRRAAALALGVLLVAHALHPARARAQVARPPERGWSAGRVAKWALLGAAVSLGAFALEQHRRADRAYDELRTLCHADTSRCRMAGGRYVEPEAERLFGQAVAGDRRARLGIIGGQVTLLGSAALFVYDLRNARGPADIPYPSGAAAAREAVIVGARLEF
jgi:hypothetical protein